MQITKIEDNHKKFTECNVVFDVNNEVWHASIPGRMKSFNSKNDAISWLIELDGNIKINITDEYLLPFADTITTNKRS